MSDVWSVSDLKLKVPHPKLNREEFKDADRVAILFNVDERAFYVGLYPEPVAAIIPLNDVKEFTVVNPAIEK